MPDIKWIKLDVGIFEDEKIKIIASMPEGRSMLVVWLKLLCLAGRLNNAGVLMLHKTIPYTPEMLCAVFNEPAQVMTLALDTFQRLGMVEVLNGAYYLPNWEKHQSEDKMAVIREKERIRKAKQRDVQRLLADNSADVPGTSTGQSQGQSRPCPTDVPPQNKNQSKEKEQEEEGVRSAAAPARTPHGEFGWVKLTEDEHERLLADMGQAELARCIRYVDESAQSSGNRNKWKDWNLLIRRCHREKWGVSAPGASAGGGKRVAFQNYDLDDESSRFTPPDLLAEARELAQKGAAQ